jgi:hypothetical protein
MEWRVSILGQSGGATSQFQQGVATTPNDDEKRAHPAKKTHIRVLSVDSCSRDDPSALLIFIEHDRVGIDIALDDLEASFVCDPISVSERKIACILVARHMRTKVRKVGKGDERSEKTLGGEDGMLATKLFCVVDSAALVGFRWLMRPGLIGRICRPEKNKIAVCDRRVTKYGQTRARSRSIRNMPVAQTAKNISKEIRAKSHIVFLLRECCYDGSGS